MRLKTSLLAGVAASAVLGLLPVAAEAAPFRVAFLAASSENGFNQATFAGIQQAAKDLGVEVTMFDGGFDSAKQYSQVEDVIAGGKFDGMIVTPNDTVGIATALEEATKAGMKVVATQFPIGPNLDTLQPQVPGLSSTIATLPSVDATAQANAVVAFCADKDPCNVMVFLGQLIFPFDNLRNDIYKKILGEHPNIKIVASGEGNYDPQLSMTVMQNVLQAHSDIDAILSVGDQQIAGAEIALRDAGIEPSSIYMMGLGLNQIMVDSIRAGDATATLAQHPFLLGSEALKAMDTALKGGTPPVSVDVDTLVDVPLVVDKPWLDAHPDFKAEWQG
ncbi:MAG TPA: sugar ABC transporter substrate-binding protein [Devosiaceae bacterium]|jgi:ribose transport system substrate-binding protein